jgi:hypothetical protein
MVGRQVLALVIGVRISVPELIFLISKAMNSTAIATYLSSHQLIIILAILWTLPWKGVALWKTARNQSAAWFVVILLTNTLGILEIFYIFFFSKKEASLVNTVPSIEPVEKKIV